MRKIVGYTAVVCGVIVLTTMAQEQDVATANLALVFGLLGYGLANWNWREIVKFFGGKNG